MNNLKQMKALCKSEPKNWIIISGCNILGWKKKDKFPDADIFTEDEVKTLGYKLINIKDKKIVDAVLSNPDVEVEFSDHMSNGYFLKEKNFFYNYQSDTEYRLAPTETKEIEEKMRERLLVDCKYCGNTHNVMSGVDFKCPDCDGLNVWNGIKYRKEIVADPQFNGVCPFERVGADSVGIKMFDDEELKYEEVKNPIHGVNEFDCKSCGNYINDEFSNANCNGCSKNPFYINCYTPIKLKNSK